MSRFDVKADLVVVPVATTLVAHRTHCVAVVCVATLQSVAHTDSQFNQTMQVPSLNKSSIIRQIGQFSDNNTIFIIPAFLTGSTRNCQFYKTQKAEQQLRLTRNQVPRLHRNEEPRLTRNQDSTGTKINHELRFIRNQEPKLIRNQELRLTENQKLRLARNQKIRLAQNQELLLYQEQQTNPHQEPRLTRNLRPRHSNKISKNQIVAFSKITVRNHNPLEKSR